MEKLEIRFVLMLRKKNCDLLPANFKRNVYDQNFYWGGGGRDSEWYGGNRVAGVIKLFVGGRGTEGTTIPTPQKVFTVHNPMGCIRIPLSQFLKN